MDRRQEAVKLFKEGYNCAQSVFTAYADIYGIDKETALKLASSFGGGMGRMREVCGAVSGMLMVAGLETGTADAKNQVKKKQNYETVRKMAEEFKKVSGGSIICKELLGLVAMEKDAAPSNRTKEYYQKRPCVQLIEEAADIVERILLSEKES